MTKELTQRRLKELLHYDPNTGIFTWRRRRGCRAAGSRAGADHHSGYWRIRVDDRLYNAHRLAWFYVLGKWPAEQIDHVNGMRSDNRFDNLRSASHAQNCANSAIRSDSKSRVKGVTRLANGWIARIFISGKRIHLGRFPTSEAAHQAYAAATNRARGEFARSA